MRCIHRMFTDSIESNESFWKLIEPQVQEPPSHNCCGKAFPWLASPQITSASADGRQVLHLNIEAVSSRKMEIKRRSVLPREEKATLTLCSGGIQATSGAAGGGPREGRTDVCVVVVVGGPGWWRSGRGLEGNVLLPWSLSPQPGGGNIGQGLMTWGYRVLSTT